MNFSYILFYKNKEVEQQSSKDTKSEKWHQLKTILVVDDDDNWCFITKKILQKAGFGKEILTATNGLEAYKMLQTMAADGDSLPDLIFLDIKMPVMDGFAFLDEVTKSADMDLSRTKIYICSSSFLAKDQERAKLYSVSGFITKPLTLEMLNKIIE